MYWKESPLYDDERYQFCGANVEKVACYTAVVGLALSLVTMTFWPAIFVMASVSMRRPGIFYIVFALEGLVVFLFSALLILMTRAMILNLPGGEGVIRPVFITIFILEIAFHLVSVWIFYRAFVYMKELDRFGYRPPQSAPLLGSDPGAHPQVSRWQTPWRWGDRYNFSTWRWEYQEDNN
ncbi:hypothetical protein AAVH_29042 [Aphelenchoides avenae]|nr:hypothetical protein AAVH_29042 [Aphelenchus avenae]